MSTAQNDSSVRAGRGLPPAEPEGDIAFIPYAEVWVPQPPLWWSPGRRRGPWIAPLSMNWSTRTWRGSPESWWSP